MEICIDVQAAIAQRAGVGRYTQSLVQSLDRPGPHDLRLFFFDFHRRGLPFPVSHARPQAVRWCPGRVVQKAWKSLGWPPYDWFAGRADVYHFPNFILPPLRRGKAVVTIHDMSFVRLPQFAEERNRAYLSAHIAATARRADAIITDSHFSAREIQDLLSVPADRLFPIHPGIAPEFHRPPEADLQRARAALGLTRPYWLTVGTFEPRKNLPFLIAAFEQARDFDGDLVLAGGLGWKFEPILERVRASPRAANIRLLHGLDDAALPALYAGAELFAIASHYEGFGFPPLEAMACGTPVLSSRGGSLPEVLGDAALLMEPTDPAAWAAEAARLAGDRAERDRLVQRGLAQAATYRWERAAAQTWAVYEKLGGRAAP